MAKNDSLSAAIENEFTLIEARLKDLSEFVQTTKEAGFLDWSDQGSLAAVRMKLTDITDFLNITGTVGKEV